MLRLSCDIGKFQAIKRQDSFSLQHAIPFVAVFLPAIAAVSAPELAEGGFPSLT
jgi:hypothetical protein